MTPQQRTQKLFSLLAKHTAVDKNACLKILEKEISLEETDDKGRTPLLSATFADCGEVISKLIALGADINARAYDKSAQKHSMGALSLAVFLGCKNAFNVLVTAKAGIEVADDESLETPLLTAARFGQYEYAEKLIAAGAKLEARNDLGETPLRHAVRMDNPDMSTLLIDAGADVNAADNNGTTPLMGAAQQANRAIIKKLIDAGARADIPANGRLATDWAKDEETAEFIRQAIAARKAKIHLAVSNGMPLQKNTPTLPRIRIAKRNP